MVGPALQKRIVNPARPHLRRGMRVRNRPPELLPVDAHSLLQFIRYLVVQTWRERGQVARYQIELRLAVVERKHPMVNGIVHAR